MKYLIFVMLLLSQFAHAEPVYYSDRATFEAAVGPGSGWFNRESFEADFDADDTVSFSCFDVSETGGKNYVSQLSKFPTRITNAATLGADAVTYDDNGESTGVIDNFCGVVNAVGLDITSERKGTITVRTDEGKTAVKVSANTPQFVGVIDEANNIEWMSFEMFNYGPSIGIDDVVYGQVPEPPTLALFALMCCGMVYAKKSKRQ